MLRKFRFICTFPLPYIHKAPVKVRGDIFVNDSIYAEFCIKVLSRGREVIYVIDGAS